MNDIVEETKKLVEAFRLAHPGKRIAIGQGGVTKLVSETPEEKERYEKTLTEIIEERSQSLEQTFWIDIGGEG